MFTVSTALVFEKNIEMIKRRSLESGFKLFSGATCRLVICKIPIFKPYVGGATHPVERPMRGYIGYAIDLWNIGLYGNILNNKPGLIKKVERFTGFIK